MQVFRKTHLLAFFAYILFSASTALSDPAADPPSEDSSIQIKEVSTSHDIGSDGAFSYSIPVKVPAFRGLEPKLSLNYSSHNDARRGPNTFLGAGWTLGGLSVIDRVSVGGGVPTFTAENDLYRLDGMELLACDDTAATNGWGQPYPPDYKTNIPSASCSHGGKFVTLRDNYKRIFRTSGNGANGAFTITDASGVQYFYESVGKLANVTASSGTDLFKAAFQRQWVLTEIRDTQVNPNIVTIEYVIEPASQGFASYPKVINYGGYKVLLRYEANPYPMAETATGTQYFETRHKRLSSIEVKNGGTGIRAYSMHYENVGLTKTNRLVEVREYGNDYTQFENQITGGSQLPSWQFSYAPDDFNFSEQSFPGRVWHSRTTIADTDENGREELLLWDYEYSCCDHLRHSVDEEHVSFSKDGLIESVSIPHLPLTFHERHMNESDNSTIASSLGVTRHDTITGFQYALISTKTYAPYITSPGLSTYRVGDATKTLIDSLAAACNNGLSAVMGQFDMDLDYEILHGGEVYDVAAGAFVAVPSAAGQLSQALCTTNHDFADFGFGVGDIDGDGLDEVIGKSAYYDLRNGSFERVEIVNSPYSSNHDFRDVRFGDVNGDGLADAVVHRFNSTHNLGVQLSTGKEFLPIDYSWSSGISGFNMNADGKLRRSQVRDVNHDGLADFILHRGHNNHDRDEIRLSNEAFILVSDGTKFLRPQGRAGDQIDRFLGAGDFDGNGMIDFISSEMNGHAGIVYNQSHDPNVLISMKDQLGGMTEISYKPSSSVEDNDIPGTQFLVSKIVRRDGVDSAHTTEFAYYRGRYDDDFRRSLGYEQIDAYLPRGNGQATSPLVRTIYETTHWGLRGLPKERLVYGSAQPIQTAAFQAFQAPGGQAPGAYLSRETTSYEATTATARPMRAQRAEKNSWEYWGQNEVHRRTTYDLNIYNQPVQVTQFGFGDTNASQDDVTTGYRYQVNGTAFITNKPDWKATASGSTVSYHDRSNWLAAEYYAYDGNPNFWVAPTRGNVTKISQWRGLHNHSRRDAATMIYDDWGNVLSSTDARGNATQFTYETTKHLFLTSSTNALGHVEATSWYQLCGVPWNTTNANGQQTTYVYDVFCREVEQTAPNGLKKWTSYVDFGTPDDQHIRQRTHSASTQSGMQFTETRDYFNGLGQSYKSARSGTQDLESDLIVSLRSFDGQGSLAWASIPLSWAQAASNSVSAAQRTETSYDALQRPLRIDYPDGTHSEMEYMTVSFSDLLGQQVDFPTVRTQDAHCFDAGSANTICGKTWVSRNSAGEVIRKRQVDAQMTDVGAQSPGRVTHYSYDGLGRLMGVKDPIGAIWSYNYDSFGNRTQAADPALGTWLMEYDDTDNLTRQTDAKNQVITFAYDALNRVTLKSAGPNATRTEIQHIYDEPRAGFFNTGQLTSSHAWTPQDGHFHRAYYDYNNMGWRLKALHDIEGRSYNTQYAYRINGSLSSSRLPYLPGSTSVKWLPSYDYDAANRPTTYGPHITATAYSLWDQPLQKTYDNGVTAYWTYHPQRGWLNQIEFKKGSNVLDDVTYSRSATGRIYEQDTAAWHGRFSYTYDYAGRLLSSISLGGAPQHDQFFTYDAAGSMRSNSHIGSYNYAAGKHVPSSITFANNGGNYSSSIDANGNMTTVPTKVGAAYRPKAITYDAENRPVEVTFDGNTTRYVYGVDGSRLKKIERVGTAQETTTVTFEEVEIRNYGQGSNEEIVTYPHSDVRFINDVPSYLHRDHQQGLKLITSTGTSCTRDWRAVYLPFGKELGTDFCAGKEDEHGWIGERRDEDAALNYLNARYYDSDLASFIPADWFDDHILGPQQGNSPR